MSEQTIPPCPVCGTQGYSPDDRTGVVMCPNCYVSMHRDGWSRLSRAAALMRAVEGLDAYHHEHWQHAIEIEVMQNETIGIYVQPGKLSRGATLADALIALAGEVAK